MTKPTLRDVVNGTPEGLAAVQGAMERSAEEMDRVRKEAAVIRKKSKCIWCSNTALARRHI